MIIPWSINHFRNVTDQPYNYVTSEPRYLANASLGYRFTVVGRRVHLQLNVSNLLDDSDPVYTAIRGYNGITYRSGYYYNEPRKFILTATVEL